MSKGNPRSRNGYDSGTLIQKSNTMADLIQAEKAAKGSRAIRRRPMIDMTPMVDLAFLLLTFFVLAATLTKPKVIEIIYPDSSGEPSPINEDGAVTLLLGHSREQTFYYEGLFRGDSTQLLHTDFSPKQFRAYLFQRNGHTIDEVNVLRNDFQQGKISGETFRVQYSGIVSAKGAPVVIIKTCEDTPYERIISAMDELNLTEIRNRVIQRMSDEEMTSMEEYSHENPEIN
ncbi:MAG: biopolymer transporter ExbD [Flavobacteriales bacterium]|nr:biopolymer transporter ExbD [Flavobacteriales bacterium]